MLTAMSACGSSQSMMPFPLESTSATRNHRYRQGLVGSPAHWSSQSGVPSLSLSVSATPQPQMPAAFLLASLAHSSVQSVRHRVAILSGTPQPHRPGSRFAGRSDKVPWVADGHRVALGRLRRIGILAVIVNENRPATVAFPTARRLPNRDPALPAASRMLPRRYTVCYRRRRPSSRCRARRDFHPGHGRSCPAQLDVETGHLRADVVTEDRDFGRRIALRLVRGSVGSEICG